MRNIKLGSFIAALLMVTTGQAMAQDEEHENQGWSGGMGISRLNIDKVAAAKELIGDTAFSFTFFGSYNFSSRVVATLGLSGLLYDDNAKFSEQVVVTDIFGSDVELLTSEARGFNAEALVEYLSPPVSALGLQFRGGGGYGALLGSQRSIDECTDCREDDLELDGGLFFTAGIFKKLSDSYKVGFSGRQYASGDINSSARLWFEFSR